MLKARQRKLLEAEAQQNPGGQAAQILKEILQQEARAIDLMRQASERAKKDSTRQKILVGAALINEAMINPAFKAGLEKVLRRHLTAARDIEFLKTFGWSIEHETNEKNGASAPALAAE
jgi:hypothetical protein